MFVNLHVGDVIRIDPMNGTYKIAPTHFYVQAIILDSKNYIDYTLEFISEFPNLEMGLFKILDKNDCECYETELTKQEYIDLQTKFSVYKISKNSYWSKNNGPVTCVCDSTTLFRYGCKCGAFKREMEKKGDL
jgi:hypothetical protein